MLVELTKAETVGMIRKAVALKYATSNMAQNDIVDVQRTIRKDRAQSSVKKGFITTNRRRKVYQCDKRLRLDDAVAQLNKSEDLECAMAGWSSARIRAFKALKEKPNTYYYRFNAPGEQQRNGTWTKEEHESFMKRLADVGADGNWGIFSMTIPGRVGYQCANYYRKQIELRKVTDDNYVLDQKGKAHFVFGTKSREALVQRSDDEESPRQPKRLKKKSPVSDSKPDDERSTSSTIPESDADVDFKDKAGHHYVLTNPLPGFVDVITQLEVVRPAISPYGHVLSYDTWLKCLCTGDRRNMCPFTNQPLHKRQLVLLTEDNSAIYQDVIKFIQ